MGHRSIIVYSLFLNIHVTSLTLINQKKLSNQHGDTRDEFKNSQKLRVLAHTELRFTRTNLFNTKFAASSYIWMEYFSTEDFHNIYTLQHCRFLIVPKCCNIISFRVHNFTLTLLPRFQPCWMKVSWYQRMELYLWSKTSGTQLSLKH